MRASLLAALLAFTLSLGRQVAASEKPCGILDQVKGLCLEPRAPMEIEKKLIRDELEDGFKGKKLYEADGVEVAKAKAAGDYLGQLLWEQEADRDKREMLDHFNRAVWFSERIYQVGPRKREGFEVGGPMNGTDLKEWNPQVQLDMRVVIERESKGSGKRYLPITFPEKGDFGAITLDSGDVRISLQTLELARDSGDPGVIALSLYHESIHYSDLMASDRLNTHEAMEEHAYAEAAEKVDVLIGDRPGDPNWRKKWKDFCAKDAEYNRNKVAKGETHRPWYNDGENDAFKHEFDLQEARRAAIMAERQRLRERMEADTFNREEERRARERGMREEEAANEQVANWGDACGITKKGPGTVELAGYTLRFRARNGSDVPAAFMLAAACADPGAKSPCIDAVSSLNRNWSDAAFKNALLLGVGSSESIAICIDFFVKHYRPGDGFKDVRKTIEQHYAELAAETERERRRSQREFQRRESPEHEQPQTPTPRARQDCERGTENGIPWREVNCH